LRLVERRSPERVIRIEDAVEDLCTYLEATFPALTISSSSLQAARDVSTSTNASTVKFDYEKPRLVWDDLASTEA